MVRRYLQKGWIKFSADPVVSDWVSHALPAALNALKDPAQDHWYQCKRTWFVGVDALHNDAQGKIGGSGPLTKGDWARFLTQHFGRFPALHHAQLSVIFPGYPLPREAENDAAFRYRQKRYGAHVDGILAIGADRQRMIREPHAFVLGVPLNPVGTGAAPLVVWEGSHRIMQQAFVDVLRPYDPLDWSNIDITKAYQNARRRVFDTCPMIRLTAQPGESYLLHRHCLHGVAGWAGTKDLKAEETTKQQSRMIAYFRPELSGGIVDWLACP